ncbi:xanthine dehydrogenase family protein subunit M [Streptomyces sp. 35G-GA-8]|uniref:FAD binding domain-containing protein n=1 Tax=Streptomyces sp. 35G-GA-8 TaxID=2939434 RepID=UPI00201EFDEB|nr:xanthine dehydrogenase family protein subunit M [Streptomyces sp. 35G-GA-8]MCL7380565.1 xanthine dehydrogenase family protein subunit M [Streptomyces sp. 35G-GA-8]
MRGFEWAEPDTVDGALEAAGGETAYLAGGTTLVDLMKLQVMNPSRVVAVNRLPLGGIRVDSEGLHLGALARMSEVAEHPEVVRGYPVISRALLLSASQQLRNMASMGGNLLQRTRCPYFRDVAKACNKRAPGSGCAALDGFNRTHAILGTSSHCVATHASDVAVALIALDATVHLRGAAGSRTVQLASLYRTPGSTPHVENTLRPGELITGITVPPLAWARNSTYLKIRDRQSYEFALTSAAVALKTRGRRIEDARVAVGGVGTMPWRLPEVEAALRGKVAGARTFEDAAAHATEGARPLSHNAFKIPLLRRTLVRALLSLEA